MRTEPIDGVPTAPRLNDTAFPPRLDFQKPFAEIIEVLGLHNKKPLNQGLINIRSATNSHAKGQRKVLPGKLLVQYPLYLPRRGRNQVEIRLLYAVCGPHFPP